LFVYWDGQLAYVLNNKDDNYKFDRMPSRDIDLNAVYAPKR